MRRVGALVTCTVAIALGAAVSGCPRSRTTAHARPTPTPHDWPQIRAHGSIEKHSDGSFALVDSAAGLKVPIPKGWSAATQFAADGSGPPQAGEPEARFRSENGCVIDLAVLPPPPSDLGAALAAGRELFFLAKIDRPAPKEFPHRAVWTATTIPSDAVTTDVGYWIDAETRWIRVEGRCPTDRVPECKTDLDTLVEGITAASPASGPQASRAG